MNSLQEEESVGHIPTIKIQNVIVLVLFDIPTWLDIDPAAQIISRSEKIRDLFKNILTYSNDFVLKKLH